MSQRSLLAGRPVARLMLVAALATGTAVTSAAVASGSDTPHETPRAGDSGEAVCLNEQEQEFLKLINEYRADNDLPKLTASKTLDKASFLHSKDMADNDYFEHDSPDGSTPEDRMEEAGYDTNTSTGENIAAGYATAQEAFDTWRESPGHNENMLSEDYAAIGIGLASNEDSEYGDYWTTDFGGEADAAPNCAP